MSVRQLAAELGGDEERGIPARYPDLRGTSYGGVRHYWEGKPTNPRVELLRAMADVLRVRADWLAFDDGPMTEEEAEKQERIEGVARATAHGAKSIAEEEGLKYWTEALRVRNSVLRWWAGKPGLSVLHTRYMPHWVPPLNAACQRLGMQPAKVGEALRAPLEALGVAPAKLNEEALGDYIVSMVPVLFRIAPHVDRTPEEEDSNGS